MDPISQSFRHTVRCTRHTQECIGGHMDLTSLARSVCLVPALHTRYLGYAYETWDLLCHSNVSYRSEVKVAASSVGVQ